MSESTWLEGTVARVLWASPDGGYAVVRLKVADDEVTAVGPLAPLADDDGAFVAIEGRWETHPAHGRQFRAIGYLPSAPQTLDGLVAYLSGRQIPGIGPRLAGRIVEHFGIETLAVLDDNPLRLVEVEGIGSKRAAAVADRWADDAEDRATAVFLRGLGLRPRLVDRIRRRYGADAAAVVRRTPYRLIDDIPGIGFRTADALALGQGVAPDDPSRVRAAVRHALDQGADQGHCYLDREAVRDGLGRLGVPATGLDDALTWLGDHGRVVLVHRGDEEQVWASELHGAEASIAREIRARVGAAGDPAHWEVSVRAAERFVGVDLDPAQRHAVQVALAGGVVVVTGGPGTGKTTLVRVLLRAARELDEAWLLASPTGRAAKRLEEATGAEAKTVHRLLEYNPAEGGFQRDWARPLEADGLLIDEASMVDLSLMAAIVDALPAPAERRCALVLVGDADQLPSVGPGQVLRDLIASGAVPVARLDRVYRQGADSGILRAARAIHGGRVPRSGEHAGDDDFFLVARDDGDQARDTIVHVVAERLAAKGFAPRDDVQVLAPTRRGPLGTEQLNQALQQRLNPTGAEIKRGDVAFRVGDRVICTKNRYDVEVFNGDTGTVVAASHAGLEVSFDGNVVAWTRDELDMLDLAYAITVHKSQGSEYPAVVLALHGSHGVMLQRNLFYTAVTRARRFLCVVGAPSAWARAVARAGVDKRRTDLAWRVRDAELPPGHL